MIDLNRWEETKIYGEGNCIWYGSALRDSDIDVVRSRPKIYINRYPGSELLTRKKILCNIMNRMEKYFGRDFEFTPLSYLLPEERDLLEEDMENNPDMWYIAKPSSGRGGEGIFLINRIEDIPRWRSNSELLVQHYVENAMLLDRCKFDYRIYVLVKGFDPVEAYICNEGLTRVSTEKYKKPTDTNKRNMFVHLTNACLHKDKDDYMEDDEMDEEHGPKRLLTKSYEQLETRGSDPDLIKQQIFDVITKTVISLIPYLSDFARIAINPNIENLRCFQIFGFDIMIDQKQRAWMLEVNANPSMNMYVDRELPNGDLERVLSDVDRFIKGTVVSDAIKIVKNKEMVDVEGSFERILPPRDKKYNQYYIWEEGRKIFEKLGGVKSPEFITSSQFQRLSRL